MRGWKKYSLLLLMSTMLLPLYAQDGDSIDYLVITSGDLSAGFEPLLQWKERKGLKTAVITVDEISENYEGPSIQLKIKQCLFNYYTNHGLKWVLLGGDHEVVPVQGCYSEFNIGGNSVVDLNIPTDLFYACFEKRFDWNGLPDEKIGQMHIDGHDVIPDVYISRLPVNTLEQLKAIVDKTLEYEINPPMTGFAERMLLSGVEAWTSWDGESDTHHRSEIMFEENIPLLWEGEKLTFYDTGTDFPGGAEYNLTSSNLSDQLNSAYNYFHYAGNGNFTALAMEFTGVFDTEDASLLRSPASGVMLSTTTGVNAFDTHDPCLSEALIRNPHGGCVAFFGSSRHGFGNPEPEPELGPSFLYNASFTKHLYDTESEYSWKSFAKIAALAKNDFVYYGSSGGAFQYLLYAINPIGEPELPLYSGPLSSFDNVRIFIMGDSLTVNTGGISQCRICITSEDLSEGYQELVEHISFYTFKDIPAEFRVTITAPDYKPYHRQFSIPTGVGGEWTAHVNIYPNPVEDYLNVEFAYPEGHLQLFDLQGRMLLKQDLNPGTNPVDLSGISNGPYLLHIRSDHGEGWFKLIRN